MSRFSSILPLLLLYPMALVISMIGVLAATPPQMPELERGELGPTAFRESRYRSPTPPSVPGGWTVDTGEVRSLLEQNQALPVDVVAATLRPASDGLATAWLPNEPRLDIPGSVWLPNVGYGRLEPHIDAYFRANLERITDGDRTRCLVFYCKADCWMSWNAVRRAASYGYTCLYWYRDGTDGWSAAGLPLEEAEPVPLPDQPR